MFIRNLNLSLVSSSAVYTGYAKRSSARRRSGFNNLSLHLFKAWPKHNIPASTGKLQILIFVKNKVVPIFIKLNYFLFHLILFFSIFHKPFIRLFLPCHIYLFPFVLIALSFVLLENINNNIYAISQK